MCLFFCFNQILFFLGLGGFENGPAVDSASFGPSFSPNAPFWFHLGSIFDCRFFGNPYGAQLAPLWTHMRLGSGTFWDPGSMSVEGRLLWRPKANFKGSVGGEAPPRTLGVCGGVVATPQKELFAIAKSGTLSSVLLHSPC